MQGGCFVLDAHVGIITIGRIHLLLLCGLGVLFGIHRRWENTMWDYSARTGSHVFIVWGGCDFFVALGPTRGGIIAAGYLHVL